MITKALIQNLIRSWQVEPLPLIYDRFLKLPSNPSEIITVIGPRRSGKTYLLFAKARELLENGVPKEHIVYVSFEDERLSEFKIFDFDLILTGLREMYPDRSLCKFYFFF